MGYYEGHAIMTPTLSRLIGVLFACAVVLHSIIHKNFVECAALLSVIVVIHTSAYLVSKYLEKTKDDIKMIFRSFKRHYYIYADNLNNCIILKYRGKLTKAQFKGDELIDIEFDADASLLESFKNKLKSLDTSDVLAYKAGRLICEGYEVYRDISYVCNEVTLNKLNTIRKQLLRNTDCLDSLGCGVDVRPEVPIDNAGDAEILITLGLYIVWYLVIRMFDIVSMLC